ncbi:MAG: hypothetical protein WD648_12400 [Planctomycetaceae bacterium]
MTLIRQFSKYIALATVAGVCVWTLGCGEQGSKAIKQSTNGGGQISTKDETTIKKVETTGQAPSADKSTSDGVKKVDEKTQAGTEAKTQADTEAKVNEENANGSEAGSTTPPGGGVETP